MESVRWKDNIEHPNYVFFPITPNKTLNCTVNCAITSVDNSNFASPTTAIRYDSGKDIDSIPTTLIGDNVLLNGSVSPASISIATAAAAAAAATLCMSSDAGLKRASSCSKGVRSDTVNQSDAHHGDDAHPKKKKQKVGQDLNRKPGEKRQNKYYWAKIDVPKPNITAPKTPKAVTPKPPKVKTPKTSKPKPPKMVNQVKTPKTSKPKPPKVVNPKPRRKNDKRRPIKSSEISDHFEEEPIIDSTCKKSLNFEGSLTNDLEAVPNAMENVFGKTNQEATLTSDLEPNNVSKVMEDASKDTMGTQDIKPYIKIKEKSVLVYRRRFNSKCLYICKNLVPRFEENFKRKRLQRNKKSFGALKTFEGFNRTCLIESLLDRILRVKGKLRMLMPTKADFSHESFKCVFSLLSSRPIFTIKKRLARARRPTKPLVQDGGNGGTTCAVMHGVSKDTMPLCTQNFTITPTPPTSTDLQVYRGRKSDVIKDNKRKPRHTPRREGKQLQLYRGRKPNVIKDKNSRRKFKLKGKIGKLSLAKDSDWTDANIAEIVDGFALQLRSLKIYDDPKKWIVEVSDQNNTTDGLYEKVKLAEERINLFKKLGKFLQEMYYYQGSKDFIKWNGSVLDSVVGVYLTQNVSDFLSSNAFMNLASKYPIKPPINNITRVEHMGSQNVIVEHPDDEEEPIPDPVNEEPWLTGPDNEKELYDDALREMLAAMPYLQESKKKGKQTKDIHIDWEKIRVRFSQKSQKNPENEDSVDWDAVRKTTQNDVANAIHQRGQHNIMAKKIQKALNRIVDEHGSLDVEWLRDAPPQVAK